MKSDPTVVEFEIPKEVANCAKTLENRGFEAYLVGGCVRDLLLGLKPKDWDITTNAKPEEIIASFPKTFYENEYGTVGVVNEESKDETTKVVEITPYRLESKYSNKRHPDSVEFGMKLEEDLKRRDFTINAIALKIIGQKTGSKFYKGQIYDGFGGIKDIKDKTIKTVGNPIDRFSEDALRMLRAIRISCEISFTLNIDTEKAIIAHADGLKEISRERIRDEFNRIIMSPDPVYGLVLAEKLGVLRVFLPELLTGKDMEQNKAHSYDVWVHSLKTLQHAAKKDWGLEIRLAALFHDIGKPIARKWSDEKKDWTFHGHDVIGSRVTEKILKRLVYPNEIIEKVIKLVRWHMFFSDTDLITLSSVRRLLVNVTHENIWDLMNVRAADRIGTGRPKESPYRLRKYKAMIEEVMHDPVTVAMLKINGARIIDVTREKPGPRIGYILHALLEEVLEKPELNTKEYLEKRSQELAKIPAKELEKLGKEGKQKKEEEEKKAIKGIRDKYWVE